MNLVSLAKQFKVKAITQTFSHLRFLFKRYNVDWRDVMRHRIELGGIFTVDHYRAGNLVYTGSSHNIVTNEGLNIALQALFSDSAFTDEWYIIIYKTDNDPIAGTTYATPVYTECTGGTPGDVAEADRQAYAGDIAGAGVTNTASKAVYTMESSNTIHGAAMVGAKAAASTNIEDLGDTATSGGVMFCGAGFTAARSVVEFDVLNITYVLTAADL